MPRTAMQSAALRTALLLQTAAGRGHFDSPKASDLGEVSSMTPMVVQASHMEKPTVLQTRPSPQLQMARAPISHL